MEQRSLVPEQHSPTILMIARVTTAGIAEGAMTVTCAAAAVTPRSGVESARE